MLNDQNCQAIFENVMVKTVPFSSSESTSTLAWVIDKTPCLSKVLG